MDHADAVLAVLLALALTGPDDTNLTEADIDQLMAAGVPVQIVTAPPTPCQTTQHCAYHGWCRRWAPEFATIMSAVNKVLRTDQLSALLAVFTPANLTSRHDRTRHMTATSWKYDADRDDPLANLRIPVTSAHPDWRYIACFDRESEARPTDLEAAQLASYIEQYKVYFFGANSWYKRKLEEQPFDADAVTRVFHKWADDDWSYRVDTWQYGPFWVPLAPRFRGGEFAAHLYADEAAIGPLTLVQVMDRDKHMHTEYPSKDWATWKAVHPEVFPA